MKLQTNFAVLATLVCVLLSARSVNSTFPVIGNISSHVNGSFHGSGSSSSSGASISGSGSSSSSSSGSSISGSLNGSSSLGSGSISGSIQTNHSRPSSQSSQNSSSQSFVTGTISSVLNLTIDTMNGALVLTGGTIDGMFRIIEGLPLIGPLVGMGANETMRVVRTVDKITNDLIARLLGGTLPCTISTEYGTQCEGVRKNGGISRVIIKSLREMPLVPTFVIQIFNGTMSTILNPVVDIIVGGVRTNQ